MDYFHIRIIYGRKMLMTSSSILRETVVLVELGRITDIAMLRWNNWVLEITLLLQVLHSWRSHCSVWSNGALRCECLTLGDTEAKLPFVHFCKFTQLLELIFIFLSLFAIRIYHIYSRVEVILNLTHLLCNHRLHLIIIFWYAIRYSVMDLAHYLI